MASRSLEVGLNESHAGRQAMGVVYLSIVIVATDRPPTPSDVDVQERVPDTFAFQRPRF